MSIMKQWDEISQNSFAILETWEYWGWRARIRLPDGKWLTATSGIGFAGRPVDFVESERLRVMKEIIEKWNNHPMGKKWTDDHKAKRGEA